MAKTHATIDGKGIIGIGLALMGAWSGGDRRKRAVSTDDGNHEAAVLQREKIGNLWMMNLE